jgi:amino-acid N-acetyltransferase
MIVHIHVDVDEKRKFSFMPVISASASASIAPILTYGASLEFVPWFRSVAPYIHMHRGKTFVVAISGEAVEAGKLQALVQDLALIQSLGVKLVLVHGFRPQLAQQLASRGQVARFSHGRRITDAIALDCAQEAAGQLRYEIEAAFSQGLPGTPMAGSTVRVISGNFVIAQPVGLRDGVDFEHTGLVRKVDITAISQILDLGALVLISPFGFSPTGQAFNLEMEEVATSVALALKADKLIFVSECEGVRRDQKEAQSPICTELPLVKARQLLQHMVTAGQIAQAEPQPQEPAFYLRHCVKACEGGVARSHLVPFTVDGALLLEVYVHDGIGTMVVDEKLESLRPATVDDVPSILQLIVPWEEEGTLVKRDRTQIERDIGQYIVLEHDGVIFGCAALYPDHESRMGEMAALTVAPHTQGQGDGERILKRIEQQARALGLTQIFVLTTRAMDWFLKRGFVRASLDKLPLYRRASYDEARKSQVLIKTL